MFLYSEFIKGDLDDYDYDTSTNDGILRRKTDAAALQRTIWFIEQENHNFSFAQLDDTHAKAVLGNGSQAFKWWQAANSSGWLDIGNVRVLNLYDGVNQDQDQLAMIPLPAAALLGAAPMAGLFLSRRRPLA